MQASTDVLVKLLAKFSIADLLHFVAIDRLNTDHEIIAAAIVARNHGRGTMIATYLTVFDELLIRARVLTNNLRVQGVVVDAFKR